MKRLNPRVLTMVVASLLAIGLTPRRALAQNSLNAFVHVSFGVKIPADKNYKQTISDSGAGFSETDTYQAKAKGILSIGGGVMFTPMLGAMVSFSHYSDPETTTTRFKIPDLGFDDTTETNDDYEHKENDLHLDVVIVPKMAGALDVMVFGGLTHFAVTQDLIEDYNLNFLNNTIVTDSITKSSEKASSWGFNAGVSLSKPINKNIGVGGMVRYSHGNVKLKDMLQTLFNDDPTQTISMKVGGFEASGGVIILIK